MLLDSRLRGNDGFSSNRISPYWKSMMPVRLRRAPCGTGLAAITGVPRTILTRAVPTACTPAGSVGDAAEAARRRSASSMKLVKTR